MKLTFWRMSHKLFKILEYKMEMFSNRNLPTMRGASLENSFRNLTYSEPEGQVQRRERKLEDLALMFLSCLGFIWASFLIIFILENVYTKISNSSESDNFSDPVCFLNKANRFDFLKPPNCGLLLLFWGFFVLFLPLHDAVPFLPLIFSCLKLWNASKLKQLILI